MYLKGGGRIRSRKLVEMLGEAVAEALAQLLVRKLRLVAYLVGSAVSERVARLLGSKPSNEEVVMGIQWINTPTMYRTSLK